MRKSKRILVAYVHSHVEDQVMGVTIDSKTGKTIQAVILPTKQRVMLGLGIGDDKANAHHAYRSIYPDGYVLHWSDDPETDERLAELKGELVANARELREHDVHSTEPETVPPTEHSEEVAGSLEATGQLTTELMRGGMQEAADTGRTAEASEPDKAESDTHGGFFG